MKTEKTFLVLFSLGMILKFFRIPGGNITMLLSLMALSFIYLFASIYFLRDAETKQQKLGLSIGTGIVFFIVLIGIMFKLMYWPGALLMLLIGIMVGIFHFLLVRVMKSKKDEKLINYVRNLSIRSAVITGFACILFAIPTSVLIRAEYRNYPELAELKIKALSDPKAMDKVHDYMKKNDIKGY
jgi:hypothetical protein